MAVLLVGGVPLGGGRGRCGAATTGDRGISQKVQHQFGDAVGSLDLHEVAHAVEALVATLRRQIVEHVVGCGAPAHQLVFQAQDAQYRYPDAGQVFHGPFRSPRAEPAEPQGRVNVPPPAVGVFGGTDGHHVLQPRRIQSGVHAGPPGGQIGDGAGVSLGGGDAATMVEPSGDLAVQHAGAFVLGHVGP